MSNIKKQDYECVKHLSPEKIANYFLSPLTLDVTKLMFIDVIKSKAEGINKVTTFLDSAKRGTDPEKLWKQYETSVYFTLGITKEMFLTMIPDSF